MCLDKLNKIDEYLSTSVDDLMLSPLTVDNINKEFVEKFNELINKFGLSKVQFFFKTIRDNKLYKKYKYNDYCIECNEFFEKEISLSVLKSGVDFRCSGCIESEKKIISRLEEFDKIKRDYEHEIKRVNNTKKYIDIYLDPLKSFKTDTSLYEKWNSISFNNYSYISNEIVQYIKKMDYKSFLQTPYWKTVSYKRKAQCEFKCQLCNSNKNLETHHPTYDIKGEEINNMKKLTVLCHACHEKHHK
jgi:hypothetical protein